MLDLGYFVGIGSVNYCWGDNFGNIIACCGARVGARVGVRVRARVKHGARVGHPALFWDSEHVGHCWLTAPQW